MLVVREKDREMSLELEKKKLAYKERINMEKLNIEKLEQKQRCNRKRWAQ